MDQQATVPKIAIIGLGLMGGSLGLSLTRSGYLVKGWDADPATIEEARRIGAVNQFSDRMAETVSDVDIVFVATPVSLIPLIISSSIPYAKPGTIFSDLGSIKQAILDEVFNNLPTSFYFVPGHPMTGSEQNGISASDPFLFQNAVYILINHYRTPMEILNKVKTVLNCTGALFLTLNALEHDRIVGMVSHLPHLIAAVLAKTAGIEEASQPGTLNLAAGGFRDTTRVATGSPELWEEIIMNNKDMILRALVAFDAQLLVLREIILAEDRVGLREFLSQARKIRLQIPSKNKGFLTLLHEMVVTIEDRPGTINEVLQYLAEADLNIKDIEILRVREGDGGTLRLALEKAAAVDKAIEILMARGFKVKKR